MSVKTAKNTDYRHTNLAYGSYRKKNTSEETNLRFEKSTFTFALQLGVHVPAVGTQLSTQDTRPRITPGFRAIGTEKDVGRLSRERSDAASKLPTVCLELIGPKILGCLIYNIYDARRGSKPLTDLCKQTLIFI